MFRVVTQYSRPGGKRPIIEKGPWHPTKGNAQQWADLLRDVGYVVRLESQTGSLEETSDHSDLAAALASMA